MVMPYHLHMPSYFLETFTEYPYIEIRSKRNFRVFMLRIFTYYINTQHITQTP